MTVFIEQVCTRKEEDDQVCNRNIEKHVFMSHFTKGARMCSTKEALRWIHRKWL